jgi:hypothetical protein
MLYARKTDLGCLTDPEPPPIVDLGSQFANTRSCVGVERLMRVPTVVKASRHIL